VFGLPICLLSMPQLDWCVRAGVCEISCSSLVLKGQILSVFECKVKVGMLVAPK
jgi:hypothetical protein